MTTAIRGISVLGLILLALAILMALMTPIIAKAAVLAVAASETAASHANLKHGAEAEIARQCYDKTNATRFYNPLTGRTGLVCLTESGKYGLVVLDKSGREITAFLKNKLKTFDDVLRYMRNRGYTPVQ